MNRYIFLIAVVLLPAVFYSGVMAETETGVIDLASVGYLQIQSPVEGARVYFDQQFMGFINDGAITVPVDVTVSPQYTNLIIEYTGYQTFVGPLPKPVPGKTVGVRVELNQSGYERTGIVLFESALSGAELLLNGKSMGFTPDSGTLMIQTVPDGLYEFTVKRPGNLSIIRQQYVTSNAITVYRVNLEPALTGDLQVNTTPEGAGIYMDNRYMGISPLNLHDVLIGNQAIRITREGYQEWTGEISVVGADLNQIDAVLVSLPPTPIPVCLTVVETPEPFSTEEGSEPQLPDNIFIYAGMVIVIGLIGCIVLGIWAYRRKQ
ncbi:MAG: PEGA domain-containing protein [Methanobacteriota archaeon]